MASTIGIDWDDAFANGTYIEQAEAYPSRWAAHAQEFRETATVQMDIPYGSLAREVYDLFLPEHVPHGLIVFVHGGYWLKFDKSFWSHLASGPVARGWAVAMPSYTLAPDAVIPQITGQIARAISHAAANVAGPIHLTGHSAGGHLVTRMICEGTSLPQEVAVRIANVISISGLHDLRPLQVTRMNASLGLTPDMALSESAALQPPLPGIPVTVWVGGHERPEFLRQSALLREAWARKGCAISFVVDGACHHFNVIDGLSRTHSPLTDALLAP